MPGEGEEIKGGKELGGEEEKVFKGKRRKENRENKERVKGEPERKKRE